MKKELKEKEAKEKNVKETYSTYREKQLRRKEVI